MKLAALFYFWLLFAAHQLCGLYQPLHEPMCSFRYGEFGAIGYGLFVSMGLIGLIYGLDLRRYGQPGEAANVVSFATVLFIIGATPSEWPLHNAAAIVMMVCIVAYFALLLYRADSPLMWIHLAVPILLTVVTGFQSYGIWQKALICYLIFAAVVHHHLVKRGARLQTAPATEAFSKERSAAYRLAPSAATADRRSPRF
jgi:hypothetical protein